MKSKNLFLIAMMIFSVTIFGQSISYTWAKGAGGAGNDLGLSIKVDVNGNVYTTGYFSGTVDFDPGPGVFTLTAVSDNTFIQKLDINGNFIWAKSFGGASGANRGFSMDIDQSGNLLIAGQNFGTSDFDPNAGVFNLTSIGSWDIYVCKLDAAGNFIWAKDVGGTSVDIGQAIITDALSNVIINGYYQNTVDFDPGVSVFNLTSAGLEDIFIQKLDASGNFLWAKSIGGSSQDWGNSIGVDGVNNIYSTGKFGNTVDFDPNIGVFNLIGLGSDPYVLKLDPAGNFVWAKNFGTTMAEEGKSISIDNFGNVVTVGYFNGSGDFDPSAGVSILTSNGNEDVFIQKMDANGNFIFAKSFGGINTDESYGVKLNANGNIYTTGSFSGTVDFNPGVGVFNLSSTGSKALYIQKLSPSGNFVTAISIASSTISVGHALASNATDEVFITGGLVGSADFDPGIGVANLTSVSNYDFFVAKYNACNTPSQPTSISGLGTMCAGAGSTNYSVAIVAGATSYTWSLPGGWSGTSSTNTISATPGSSGIFTVTASNACGASPQQTLSIIVNPNPTVTANTSTTQLCVGSSATLTANGANNYTWNPGGSGASVVVSPTVNTTYTVTGTDANGCQNTTVLTQSVTNCGGVGMSDQIFTGNAIVIYPNPAGDYVKINGLERSIDVLIYNSLGSLVYKEILTTEASTILTSQFSKGMYVVKVGNSHTKLIIQ